MGFKPLGWLLDPLPAGLGIEFRHQQVVLARFTERRGRREMDLCLKAPVPSGVLEQSMLEANIAEPEGLARFLGQILDQAGVRGQRIALTLPDTLASVSVTELTNAPRSRRDLAEVLRFRLRKSLPFGMEKARIAFHPIPGESRRFLTGVMHEEVVSQYEALLEGLGFHVGVVQTSSLSLMNLWRPVAESELPSEADYFFLNIEASYFTVILVRRGLPVLFRTLGRRATDTGGDRFSPYGLDELLGEIVPTLIFYREKLGGSSPARVYYRSLRSDLDDLSGELQTQFEATVEPVDLHRAVKVADHLNVDASLASTVSAAVGAALGKAA